MATNFLVARNVSGFVVDNEEEVTYEHSWSIMEFSKKMKMKNKECLYSDVFSYNTKEGPTSWKWKCYPNGIDKCKNSVSLYLMFSDGGEFTATYKMGIVSKSGDKKDVIQVGTPMTFHPGEWFGLNSLISHQLLREKQVDLMPNDTLTVFLEITIKLDKGEESPEEKLSRDFANMLLNSKFYDCTIVTEDREFHCHKVILSGRSSVFDAMFTHDMRERDEKRIYITDFDPDTINDMIKYIYSGKVDELDAKSVR